LLTVSVKLSQPPDNG